MASIASLIRAINATEAAGMEDQAYQVQRVGQELSISARGGGVLLGILSERMTLFGGYAQKEKAQNDPATKQLCAHLLSAAAVPYFAMLRNWIHFGEVADPYDEFMVQERRGLSKEQLREDFNDIYWEQRYTLREDVIPSFLQPYKDKILLAGKYLNVVRECGVSIADVGERVQKRRPESARFAPAGDVMKAIEGGRFPEDIELAYQYANETLLELLFKDQKLRERLRSVKHYFFLDQSDFLVHFLDVAHEQLLRPSHEVPLDHVRSLLELVLRNTASVSSKDAYNEDVVAELSQISLVDQLLRINSVVGMDVKRQMEGNRTGEGMGGDGHQTETDIVGGLVGIDGASALNGIAAFMLGYTVRFPLSLVLNKKVMTKYQLLFRHLFHCKYVERQLSDSWREQGKSGLYQGGRRFGKRKGSRTERRDFGEVDAQETELEQRERREDGRLVARMCALRGKMLHLVQQFMYYVCFEVLEPSWESLDRQLAKVTTVDEVLVFHNGFLDTCLKDCMLTNPKLIKIFSKIMTTCTDFSSFCVAYLRHKSLPYRSSTAVASLHAEFGIPPGLTHAEHPSASPAVSDTPFDPLQSDTTLKNFERDFVHEVRRLIDALQFFGATETASLGNLVTRMDYNMYYARLPPDLSVVGTVPIRQGGR
ncbi:hypothetical protein HK104_003108 [Borealophlyctis nickersoniae]|nr:hypothetical protein HK104_003108 [Borealophlyctis nickersoniae]